MASGSTTGQKNELKDLDWLEKFTCSWTEKGKLTASGFSEDMYPSLRLYLAAILPRQWPRALEMIMDQQSHTFIGDASISFSSNDSLEEDDVAFCTGPFPSVTVPMYQFLWVVWKALEKRPEGFLAKEEDKTLLNRFYNHVEEVCSLAGLKVPLSDKERKTDDRPLKDTEGKTEDSKVLLTGQGQTSTNISTMARRTDPDGEPQEIFGDINDDEQGMFRNLVAASDANKAEILKKIQEYAAERVEAWKNQKVYVGVLGEPGVGKSTFINSIRGLKPKDPGAAKVGLGHTTTVVTEYSHPARPDNLIFVDFPGILLKKGTGQKRDFDIQQYPDEFGKKMQQCHVFLVFVRGSIQHNAVQIGMKARDMGMKVLFVRSQFDKDLVDKQNDDPDYFDDKTEADLMEELRQVYIKVLKEVGWEGEVNPKDVFIISGRLNYVLKGSWDIPKFRKALIEGLGALQKMVVINTCRDFSKETIKARGDVYRKRAWFVAMATTAGSFVPYAGLASMPATLTAAYFLYKEGFCLTEEAVEELAKMTNKNQEDLNKFVSCKLLGRPKLEKGEIGAMAVVQAICNVLGIATAIAVDEVVDVAIPAIGAVITAPLSFGITVKVLRALISRMEDCAGELFDYAFKDSAV